MIEAFEGKRFGVVTLAFVFASLFVCRDFAFEAAGLGLPSVRRVLCDDGRSSWSCYNDVTERQSEIITKLSSMGFEAPTDFDLKGFALNILEAEKRFGIDRDMLMAVALVESAFDEDAVSEKGAQGLFQILPGTARALWPEFVGSLDPSDPIQLMNPARDLNDTRVSTLLGAFYLSQLKSEFSGHMHLVLASYNVGPSKVKKAMKEGRLLRAEYVFRVYEMLNGFKGRTI